MILILSGMAGSVTNSLVAFHPSNMCIVAEQKNLVQPTIDFLIGREKSALIVFLYQQWIVEDISSHVKFQP